MSKGRYCFTAYGRKLHIAIAREWQDEWVTWCGEYINVWLDGNVVDETQICKRCLKIQSAQKQVKNEHPD